MFCIYSHNVAFKWPASSEHILPKISLKELVYSSMRSLLIIFFYHDFSFFFWIMNILKDVRWYLIVVLICISLTLNADWWCGAYFIYLLAICIGIFLKKCLFGSLHIFKWGFLLLLSCMSSLQMLDFSPYIRYMPCKYFLPLCFFFLSFFLNFILFLNFT